MSSVTRASRVSELDAEAHIAQYVTVLAHLLLWVVQRACRRFASGNVTKALNAQTGNAPTRHPRPTFLRSPHVARVVGSPSAPSWQAPRACKRRKASSVTRHGRHRTSPALHVTRKTRSRRLAVAPPHRHKWMLSPGAPADPSDPWNSTRRPFHPAKTASMI